MFVHVDQKNVGLDKLRKMLLELEKVERLSDDLYDMLAYNEYSMLNEAICSVREVLYLELNEIELQAKKTFKL
jgi:hypothetical protein